jgi:hypothetical protein
MFRVIILGPWSPILFFLKDFIMWPRWGNLENLLAKFGCIPDMKVLKNRIQVYIRASIMD